MSTILSFRFTFFQNLFPLNGIIDKTENVVIDERMKVISFCEPFYLMLFMFVNTTNEVIRNSYIPCAVSATRKNINKELFLMEFHFLLRSIFLTNGQQ